MNRHIKIAILGILLMQTSVFAQLSSYLNKTHRQLLGSPSKSTRLDTIIFSGAIALDSVISSLQKYGINAGDYGTPTSAITAASTGGTVRFSSTTYTIADSVHINKTLRVVGGGSMREPRMATSGSAVIFSDSLTGTIFRSTNTSGGSIVRANARGANVENVAVIGTRQNGSGFLIGVDNGTSADSTTNGLTYVRNLQAIRNGKSGIQIWSPDNGMEATQLYASTNKQYGIKVSKKPDYNSSFSGINLFVANSRSRNNGLGGWYIDKMHHSTFVNIGAIADSTVGIHLDGGHSAVLINADSEQQKQKSGAFPNTSLRVGATSGSYRWLTDINGFYGVSGVKRRVSVGNVSSSVWINTQFSDVGSTAADSGVVVEASKSFYGLFLGDVGGSTVWNPVDSIKTLSGASAYVGQLFINSTVTGGDLHLRSNKDVLVQSLDSLRLKGTDGMEINSPAQIAIQPAADQHVTIFQSLTSNERKMLRIYADVDSTATLYKQYIEIGPATTNATAHITSTVRNGFLLRGGTDSTKLSIGIPLEISGADTSERYVDFLGSVWAPRKWPVPSGRVRLFAKTSDKNLWTVDASSDSTNLNKTLNLGDTTGVVMTAPGAATVKRDGMNMKLDTFGAAAADTLVTLTGKIGDIVVISTRNSNRDIVILDAGNFALGAERSLTNVTDKIVLVAITTTTWHELAFSNND